MQRADDLAPVVLVHEPRRGQFRLEGAGGSLRPGDVRPASVLARRVLAVEGLKEAALVVVVAQQRVVVGARHVDHDRERFEDFRVAGAHEVCLLILRQQPQHVDAKGLIRLECATVRADGCHAKSLGSRQVVALMLLVTASVTIAVLLLLPITILHCLRLVLLELDLLLHSRCPCMSSCSMSPPC